MSREKVVESGVSRTFGTCGDDPNCSLNLLGQNSSEMGHEADWKTGNLPSSRVSHKTVRILSIGRWRKERQSSHLNLYLGEVRDGMAWDLPLETRCPVGVDIAVGAA